MVKGYPNFIEKYIGGSSGEIKREALLFKIGEMKRIQYVSKVNSTHVETGEVSPNDCTKILKILDNEYAVNKNFKAGDEFVNRIKNNRIRTLIKHHYKTFTSFYQQGVEYMKKYEKARDLSLFYKDDNAKMATLSLPYNHKKDIDKPSSALREVKGKYNNSIINKRIYQAVAHRESHSENVDKMIRDNIARSREANKTLSPNKTLLVPNKLIKNKSLETTTKSRTNGFQLVRPKFNTNGNVTKYNTGWRADSSTNSENYFAINKNQSMSISFDDTLKRMLAKQNPMVGNLRGTFCNPIWQNSRFNSAKKAKK